jgi:hypothetical protein
MLIKEYTAAIKLCYEAQLFHAAFVITLCLVDAVAKQEFPQEKEVGVRFKRFLRENMSKISNVKEFKISVDMPADQGTLPQRPAFNKPLNWPADIDFPTEPDVPDVGDDFRKHLGHPRVVLMEGILYHAFRCSLCHEATLPNSVEILPPVGGSFSVNVANGKVSLSADIIERLLRLVYSVALAS